MEEMGATNLNVEMDRAASAAMEAGLQLEEGRSAQEMGRIPVAVETTLSLGPTQAITPAHLSVQEGSYEIAEYQHVQDEREGEMGRKQKKMKGMGLVGGNRSIGDLREGEAMFDGPDGVFEMGGPGEVSKRKNLKFKPVSHNTDKGNQSESEQEGRGKKKKAAVVRQKPPHQE
ncbi:unnamed protein product [Linum trigynum]|uniref:Uncharacterized protein n=1 Tax=Linum trigynum TaxID=586398 RepID=A0AAV2EV37_9ROSI